MPPAPQLHITCFNSLVTIQLARARHWWLQQIPLKSVPVFVLTFAWRCGGYVLRVLLSGDAVVRADGRRAGWERSVRHAWRFWHLCQQGLFGGCAEQGVVHHPCRTKAVSVCPVFALLVQLPFSNSIGYLDLSALPLLPFLVRLIARINVIVRCVHYVGSAAVHRCARTGNCTIEVSVGAYTRAPDLTVH